MVVGCKLTLTSGAGPVNLGADGLLPTVKGDCHAGLTRSSRHRAEVYTAVRLYTASVCLNACRPLKSCLYLTLVTCRLNPTDNFARGTLGRPLGSSRFMAAMCVRS